MTTDAAIPDSLTHVDAVLAVFDDRHPTDATDHDDEVSDLLLTMVFGPERRWELACEMVGDRLDSMRLCTLADFLR